MTNYRALVLRQGPGDGRRTRIERAAPRHPADGEVVVRVALSSLNRRDALTLAGASGLNAPARIVPGCDLVGVVERSAAPAWRAGDPVLSCGRALGLDRDGGWAEYAHVPAGWLHAVPQGLGAGDAAALGSPGIAAMMGVLALEDEAITPERGAVAVTGASGGVGSIATLLLAGLGYEVVAITSQPDETGWFRALGASAVIGREELVSGSLGSPIPRWIGVIDSVGGPLLARLVERMQRGGLLAVCGTAGGDQVTMPMAPFFGRGLRLVGIDAGTPSRSRIGEAWARLASDVDAHRLACITTWVALEQAPAMAQALLDGRIRGRVGIRVGDSGASSRSGLH